MAGCAPPTGSAGHAGATANLKLTFHLDHSAGASQGVATIYRALFGELRFAKQQQWMAANYLLLVLAAIFGIGKAIEPLTECEKVIATFLLFAAVGFGYYVLIDLQRYIGRIRKRLERAQSTVQCQTT